MVNKVGKILLLEGDRVEKEDLKKSFHKEGYDVFCCETAKMAFDFLRDETPDIIISTLFLPDISGWELFREIKKDPKKAELPFILIGKKEEVGDRIQAHRLGVEEIFYKPIDSKELISVVNSIFNKTGEGKDNLPSLEEAMKAEQKDQKFHPPMEEGIKGRLKDMELVDIIQVLNMGKKTALIYLTDDNEEGKVFLKNGEVVHAKSGDSAGEEAIYYLLKWRDGDFHIEPDVTSPDISIDTTVENLLLEGMRRIDEEARDSEGKSEKKSLSEVDAESFRVIQKLVELGILEQTESGS
jgi:CheY-like chemotaxis protein